ncbi:MAG: proline--tRNA ligase [Candidatus Hydrogenedentota bacterium]
MTLYRMSNYLIPTLKEEPKEAEVISHKLMLRAGFIRKLASGIYNFLPLGFRVLNKVEKVVREEMDRIGDQEIKMPIIQPKEFWDETGRWDLYGEEMMKIKDRHNREFGLAPTAEEVVTHIIRNEIKSYRQLPITLYQINWKYRDEIRPRFGIMRCREFLMKDAYSFDKDEESAMKSYSLHYEAYCRVIERCGLRYRACEAATGAIGGKSSHEFIVLADTGESQIALCEKCNFASNVELAPAISNYIEDNEPMNQVQEILTPDRKTVEEVSEFLKVKPEKLLKTLIVETEKGFFALLISGDSELNEEKIKKVLETGSIKMASFKDVERITNAPVGFAGPCGLKDIKIIADNSIRGKRNWVTGAQKADTHIINVNLDRDFKVDLFADIRNAKKGDICPECNNNIKIQRGIEVGHVFLLGTKYSRAMNAIYQNENGEDKLIIMGCYGIGVSRIVAASIEQNNDERGIIWPLPIAPFDVIVLPLEKEGLVFDKSIEISKKLTSAGFEVILDDRDYRPGYKFADAELIGIPFQIALGKKFKETGKYELKIRRPKESILLKEEELLNFLKEKYEGIK